MAQVQPDYNITADDQNITQIIRDRLISMTVTDQTGTDSDAANLTLDDRDHGIAMPPRGVTLSIALGYEDSALVHQGLYVVDEVSVEGPPDTLSIQADSAKMAEAMKASRVRKWSNLTLKQMITTIASQYGLKPAISDDLADIPVILANQTYESDLHLLSRLAKDYDVVAKPKNGYLVFAPHNEAKAVTGQPISPVSLAHSDAIRWRYLEADRGKYARAVAHYHDVDLGRTVYVEAGSGDPATSDRKTYADQDAATKAAQAKYKSLSRSTKTCSLTVVGNPALAAEAIVTLSKFRSDMNGDWVAKRVVHTINNQGYTSQIELEPPNKKSKK